MYSADLVVATLAAGNAAPTGRPRAAAAADAGRFAAVFSGVDAMPDDTLPTGADGTAEPCASTPATEGAGGEGRVEAGRHAAKPRDASQSRLVAASASKQPATGQLDDATTDAAPSQADESAEPKRGRNRDDGGQPALDAALDPAGLGSLPVGFLLSPAVTVPARGALSPCRASAPGDLADAGAAPPAAALTDAASGSVTASPTTQAGMPPADIGSNPLAALAGATEAERGVWSVEGSWSPDAPAADSLRRAAGTPAAAAAGDARVSAPGGSVAAFVPVDPDGEPTLPGASGNTADQDEARSAQVRGRSGRHEFLRWAQALDRTGDTTRDAVREMLARALATAGPLAEAGQATASAAATPAAATPAAGSSAAATAEQVATSPLFMASGLEEASAAATATAPPAPAGAAPLATDSEATPPGSISSPVAPGPAVQAATTSIPPSGAEPALHAERQVRVSSTPGPEAAGQSVPAAPVPAVNAGAEGAVEPALDAAAGGARLPASPGAAPAPVPDSPSLVQRPGPANADPALAEAAPPSVVPTASHLTTSSLATASAHGGMDAASQVVPAEPASLLTAAAASPAPAREGTTAFAIRAAEALPIALAGALFGRAQAGQERHAGSGSGSPAATRSAWAEAVGRVAGDEEAALQVTAPVMVDPGTSASTEVTPTAAGSEGMSRPGATAATPLGQQIVRAVSLAWRDGVGEARVQLAPEHLGHVRVALRVENGAVSAVLQAETPGAREWIAAHEHDLRQALESQGLRLDSLVVTSDGEPQGRQEAQQRPRRQPPKPGAGGPRFEVQA